MRILYFYQYFTTPKGSYNPRVYEFARRWVRAGHEVTVVTSWFDRSDLVPSGFLTKKTIDGVAVRMVNIGLSNKHGILHRAYSFLAYAIVASWYALVLRGDVVVASSGPITIGLPGLVSKYLRRRPFIFEVRDLWPQGAIEMGYLSNPLLVWIARLFEKICYRAAARVVALSEGMADWIRETYGVRDIAVVPNAADNQLFDRLGNEGSGVAGPAPGTRTVVYAGNMGPGDDCGQILDMAKCLSEDPRAKDVEVVLIGDGKQGAFLRERARAERIPVRFLGFIPREKLIPIVAHADCVVFATKNLPFYGTCSPNKLFDGLAAGKPIVQTTQGWIRTLLEREDCGLTVPQNAPAEFAAAVLSILDNPVRQAELGQNARRAARSLFDRELLSRKMLDVTLAAAGGGNVGGSTLHERLVPEVDSPRLADNRKPSL